MNIADEIALNTLRYRYSQYQDITEDKIKSLKQTVGPNTKVNIGSFNTLFSGILSVSFFPEKRDTMIEVYKDNESIPILTIDYNKGNQKMPVSAFHTYTVYAANNTSSQTELGANVYGRLIPNDKMLAI